MTAVRQLVPNTARVFIVHHSDPKMNVVSAMEFGSLEAVLDDTDEPGPLNIPHITAKIKFRLQTFTEHDYLVLIGSPIAIAIASAVAALQTGGNLKILKWDKQAGRYFTAVVNI